ncbi:MAG TPA: hypothetical protein VHZ33_38750 [Trebonia sp.]|jgi:hypothetical protein|nr:hypothetical protein [Trebonia sp.]
MLGTFWFVLLALFASAIVAIFIFAAMRAFRSVSMKSRTPPVSAVQFEALVDEHRRMTDRAVTASENVDLRLADLSARVDELRSQVQRILTDVE